jgi:L-lactate dehydrogenase complex protein LldE
MITLLNPGSGLKYLLEWILVLKAQLFITCLAEQFTQMSKENGRVELDVQVEFSVEQTCCGQPLFNSGFQSQARSLARNWIETFSRSDAVVVSPSGSCVDMVRHHYPELFLTGTREHELAADLAGRTFEFTDYLVNQLHVVDVGALPGPGHVPCLLPPGVVWDCARRPLLERVR